MNRNIQVLDATLRDGGFGLEDAWKNDIAYAEFSPADIKLIAEKLQKSRIDIIELGAVQKTSDDRRKFAIYQDIESISKVVPKEKGNQIFAAMFRGPDTPISEIPDWRPGLCRHIRVILRYSELQKSLDFCAALAAKGYRMFVQPMLTMRYTDEELQMISDAANKMHAYAVYFVDSYGYMDAADVLRLYQFFDEHLDHDIRIGFHAHNNMNLAFANAQAFMNYETERPIIVDSCAIGMGQGAGNLQTEILASYLNQSGSKNFDYASILDVCDMVEKHCRQAIWGYSVTRFLPARHRVAYKYAVAMRYQYGMSFRDIDQALTDVPDDLRHRYTPENLEQLLKLHDMPLTRHKREL